MSTFSDRVHIASAVSITNTVLSELVQTESKESPPRRLFTKRRFDQGGSMGLSCHEERWPGVFRW